MKVVASGEKRLQRVKNQLGIDREGRLRGRNRPKVLCIEWIDPLMAAGHWTPDIVEQAGGAAALGEAGTPSQYVSWGDAAAADPDVIAILPCGFSLAEARQSMSGHIERPEWQSLRAVGEGRVFLFDGSAYFNRPGPRLYRSTELMARVLHPDRTDGVCSSIEDWEVQPHGSPDSTENS